MNAVKNNIVAIRRVSSKLGPLTLAATTKGLAGVWFDDQKHHPGDLSAAGAATTTAAKSAASTPSDLPADRFLSQAHTELQQYFAGQRQHFDVVLDPQGTAFQQDVWRALLTIAYGQLGTYGELAQRVGRPAAARAVGAAVGRNPLGIIVPCHRVLGKDGTLTGYAGGLHRKEALLQLEGAAHQPQMTLPS